MHSFHYPQVFSAVVEPYNAVLMSHNSLQLSSATFMLDNTSMYDVSHDRLGITTPKFSHINGLISQNVSSVTASLRSVQHVRRIINYSYLPIT